MKLARILCAVIGLAILAWSTFAQNTRVLALNYQSGLLTWTNSETNVYCGLEYTFQLPGPWTAAPAPYNSILVTNFLMTAVLPFSQIPAGTVFFRLVSSTNASGGADTYDVNANGIPEFISTNYIELAKIQQISCFRSGIGHDYSDDFESCRSMKHYFQPSNTVDWSAVQITSPVTGTITSLMGETLTNGGTQIHIQPQAWPAFTVIIFHVQTNNMLAVGNTVTAGQSLGTHIGPQTTSDIAVGVNTPEGYQLVSYFDVMTDSLFAAYQARGVNSRTNLIISAAARDADPLTCDTNGIFLTPGSLTNWVDLQ